MVGISNYKDLYPFKGIAEDLESWKKTLLGLGYEEENITVLQNASATRDHILSCVLKPWPKKQKLTLLFFFFRGQGLVQKEDLKGNPRVLHLWAGRIGGILLRIVFRFSGPE